MALNLTDLEVKVEEATNNEPWGPHGTVMAGAWICACTCLLRMPFVPQPCPYNRARSPGTKHAHRLS